jgi:hypothetical protein
MTFQSTIETLSDTIETLSEVSEAELDRVVGGMINQNPDGTKRRPGPSAADVSQHP